ncbi:MAG: hypothetical protein AAF488_12500 [Planctomycetota bacterium]
MRNHSHRTSQWTLVAALLFTLPALAIDVLVYDVNTQSQNGQQAAIQAGYDVTVSTSEGDFITQLSTGIWDLVSLDVPSSGMSVPVAEAVEDFVAADGVAMICFWNLDTGQGTPGPILRDAFQVATTVSFSTPLDVFAWELTHPIFTTPNVLTMPLVPTLDPWGDDGDRMTANGAALELGGFSSVAASGEAAIILGNDGRTIVNGFIYDDFLPGVIIPFLQNEMEFLLSGGGPTGPVFRRGDVNDDGVFDVSDMVFGLASLFIPGSDFPPCVSSADLNDEVSSTFPTRCSGWPHCSFPVLRRLRTRA